MTNQFKKYLATRDPAKVAKRLGITASMVSRLKTGARRPSISLALRIQVASRGEVPMKSWSKRERAAAHRR